MADVSHEPAPDDLLSFIKASLDDYEGICVTNILFIIFLHFFIDC